MSTTRYLGAMLLTILALSAVAVLLPHSTYVRYQSLNGTMFERTRYFYERLHFDPAPVDIIILGASRAAAGISSPHLEADLAKRGKNLRVVNLSLPAAAMDMNLVIAREALRERPDTRMMIVLLPDAFPRQGNAPFAELATNGDIFANPVPWDGEWLRALGRLPMRQMQLFARTHLPGAFGYTTRFDPALYPGTTVDRDALPGWKPPVPQEGYHTAAHKAVVDSQSALRHRLLSPPKLPPALSWLEYGASQAAARKLIQLCHEKHTRLIFVYVPYYKGPQEPREAAWLRTQAPLWVETSVSSDPSLYADSGHPSSLALPVLSAWLADRIAAVLPQEAAAGVTSGGKP